jgi:hypothetical protein
MNFKEVKKQERQQGDQLDEEADLDKLDDHQQIDE